MVSWTGVGSGGKGRMESSTRLLGQRRQRRQRLPGEGQRPVDKNEVGTIPNIGEREDDSEQEGKRGSEGRQKGTSGKSWLDWQALKKGGVHKKPGTETPFSQGTISQ